MWRELQKSLAPPGETSVDLIDYANSYTIDTKLRHKAILLQAQYYGAETSRDKVVALEEMADLVSDIKAWQDEASPQVLEEFAERQRFLETRRGVELDGRVVFRGTGIGFGYGRSDFRLSGVDLCLEEGKITGVLGENANGKTTLFRIVVGRLKQDEGTVEYPLLNPAGAKRIDWPAVKEHIAYVPQELPPLYGTMEENLRYVAAAHGQLGADNDLAVNHIVTRLHLTEHLGRKWAELSGGYKLRFALARALISKPKLLALDEPLANLDIVSQLTVLRDIRDLARSFRDPIAVLISSQHLHEIEAVADNILFLRRGKVVFNGPIETIGHDAEQHVFEVGTSLDGEDLRRKLHGPEILSISHNGMSYVITTERKLSRDKFLAHLTEQRVSIDYFRDISRSVKLLFEGEDADGREPFL